MSGAHALRTQLRRRPGDKGEAAAPAAHYIYPPRPHPPPPLRTPRTDGAQCACAAAGGRRAAAGGAGPGACAAAAGEEAEWESACASRRHRGRWGLGCRAHAPTSEHMCAAGVGRWEPAERRAQARGSSGRGLAVRRVRRVAPRPAPRVPGAARAGRRRGRARARALTREGKEGRVPAGKGRPGACAAATPSATGGGGDVGSSDVAWRWAGFVTALRASQRRERVVPSGPRRGSLAVTAMSFRAVAALRGKQRRWGCGSVPCGFCQFFAPKRLVIKTGRLSVFFFVLLTQKCGFL